MLVRYLLACFISFSAISLHATALADINDYLPKPVALNPAQQTDIEVFVRNGCPHCAKAETFLASLKREQPALTIVYHELSEDPDALKALQNLAQQHRAGLVRVPAFLVHGQLIVGYSDELTSGRLIRDALSGAWQNASAGTGQDDAGTCEAVSDQALSCGPEAETPKDAQAAESAPKAKPYELDFFGHTLSLDEIGLPLFTIAMGLLDGFNPCSLWVLILMISLLAPMNNRWRMFAVAGTFIAVEGIAYFVFMAAWLNLFLLIGLSRISAIVIALIAIGAGLINLKDFWFFGRGISLSISDKAKPGIYAAIRRVIHAQNLTGALIGVVVLAILVQIVEFMCTSGFPALFTRILTLKQLDAFSYYAYLLLYNLAYMFDDMVILAIGVVTLSQHRLQEKEGRWLKLLSGLVMVGLGIYLVIS